GGSAGRLCRGPAQLYAALRNRRVAFRRDGRSEGNDRQSRREEDRIVPFVICGGSRLYWRSDGDPALPALLLGNSLGTELALWAPVIPALRRHFRVLSFDLRGHGASEAPAGEY